MLTATDLFRIVNGRMRLDEQFANVIKMLRYLTSEDGKHDVRCNTDNVRTAGDLMLDTMLHTIIIRHLEHEWPRTLAEWGQQQYHRTNGGSWLAGLGTQVDPETQHVSRRLKVKDYKNLPEPASAIRFAIEFDCPSILPAAFYELAHTNGFVEWDDVVDDIYADCLTRPARWNVLTASDLRRVMKGKLNLDLHFVGLMKAVMLEDDADYTWAHESWCRVDQEDSAECLTRLESFIVKHLTQLSSVDILNFLFLTNKSLGPTDDEATPEWCCRQTYATVRVFLRQHALVIWDSLPSYFSP